MKDKILKWAKSMHGKFSLYEVRYRFTTNLVSADEIERCIEQMVADGLLEKTKYGHYKIVKPPEKKPKPQPKTVQTELFK